VRELIKLANKRRATTAGNRRQLGTHVNIVA
jgi:hypothetical protein